MIITLDNCFNVSMPPDVTVYVRYKDFEVSKVANEAALLNRLYQLCVYYLHLSVSRLKCYLFFLHYFTFILVFNITATYQWPPLEAMCEHGSNICIYNIYVKKYSSWVIGLFCSWHMTLFLPIDHPCCHNNQQLVQRWIAHEALRKGLLFSRAPLSLSHLSLYGKTGILGKGGWPFPKTATLSLCVLFIQEKRKNSNLVFKMSQTNRKQKVKPSIISGLKHLQC